MSPRPNWSKTAEPAAADVPPVPRSVATSPVLRSVVEATITRFGQDSGGLFKLCLFQRVLREYFDLKDTPSGEWCIRVLEQLPYIESISRETGTYWRLKDTAAGGKKKKAFWS